jgi:hypothetical protein
MLGILLLAAVLLFALQTDSPADDENGHLFDFDSLEPVRYRAPVMDLELERKRLTVAEREIRLLDMVVRGREIKTRLVDGAGVPVELGLFRPGQVVEVEGYLHPEGYVLALSICQSFFPRGVVRADGYALKKNKPRSRNNRNSNP